MIQLLTLIPVSYELMIICTSCCIRLLTYLYFIIAINTGLEIERVCKPRPKESPGSYYARAREYYAMTGNEEEEERVIDLNWTMRQTEKYGWIIPRTAEYWKAKVERVRNFAMMYSCERSFDKLRDTIAYYDTAMDVEEQLRYKLLGGWTSDANWDDKLKDREAEMKSNKWVGGVPSQIRKQEASIRKHQEKQRKKWDPIMLG